MSDEVALRYVIPLIFLLSGAGLLTGALVLLVRTRAFLARAAETVGQVVALDEEPLMEAGDPHTYRPIVSFQVAGTPIRFESMAHSNPPEYEIGASVRVLYDRDRPSEARIRSFVSLWLLPMILGSLGFIFTVVGSGLLLGYIPP
ncbi:MAG: DUF3592 domain-containing protein [Gammaproteobacteria bacterium]